MPSGHCVPLQSGDLERCKMSQKKEKNKATLLAFRQDLASVILGSLQRQQLTTWQLQLRSKFWRQSLPKKKERRIDLAWVECAFRKNFRLKGYCNIGNRLHYYSMFCLYSHSLSTVLCYFPFIPLRESLRSLSLCGAKRKCVIDDTYWCRRMIWRS